MQLKLGILGYRLTVSTTAADNGFVLDIAVDQVDARSVTEETPPSNEYCETAEDVISECAEKGQDTGAHSKRRASESERGVKLNEDVVRRVLIYKHSNGLRYADLASQSKISASSWNKALRGGRLSRTIRDKMVKWVDTLPTTKDNT